MSICAGDHVSSERRGRGVSPGYKKPALCVHSPCAPASIQEVPLSFQLHRIPHVAALLLLAPLASTGPQAPAKPRDLHTAQTRLSVQGEPSREITIDETLLCACFLGEQPGLHGTTSFFFKPGPCLCKMLAKFSFYPAPCFPHSYSQPSSLISLVLVNLSKPHILLHPSRGGGRQLLCPGMWWVSDAGCVASPMPDVCPHLKSSKGKEKKGQGEFYLHISWHKWA